MRPACVGLCAQPQFFDVRAVEDGGELCKVGPVEHRVAFGPFGHVGGEGLIGMVHGVLPSLQAGTNEFSDGIRIFFEIGFVRDDVRAVEVDAVLG